MSDVFEPKDDGRETNVSRFLCSAYSIFIPNSAPQKCKCSDRKEKNTVGPYLSNHVCSKNSQWGTIVKEVL